MVEASCGVFIVDGNHDAWHPGRLEWRFPPNVHWFGPGRLGTRVLEDAGVAIHGRGLPHPHCRGALAADYPAPVRCAAIRAKALDAGRRASEGEVSDAAWDIVLLADQYQRALFDTAARLQPNPVCDYLLRLAKAFNKLYAAEKVITDGTADERLLALVERVQHILAHGLEALGIPVPERM